MSDNVPTSIDEIEFSPHLRAINGTRALLKFSNGYGASIITGSCFYTDENRPYELAVFHNGSIDYSHGIEDNTDVFGYCDAKRVLALLKAISELPARA